MMELKDSNPQSNVRQAPASPTGVGNERKADMSAVGPSGLGAAVSHLKDNHANGTKHDPLHGMKAGK